MEIWGVQRFVFGVVGFDCLSKTASLKKIGHLYTLVVHFACVCEKTKESSTTAPQKHRVVNMKPATSDLFDNFFKASKALTPQEVVQGGPLPVISRVMTPISGVGYKLYPQANPFIFRHLYGLPMSLHSQ